MRGVGARSTTSIEVREDSTRSNQGPSPACSARTPTTRASPSMHAAAHASIGCVGPMRLSLPFPHSQDCGRTDGNGQTLPLRQRSTHPPSAGTTWVERSMSTGRKSVAHLTGTQLGQHQTRRTRHDVPLQTPRPDVVRTVHRDGVRPCRATPCQRHVSNSSCNQGRPLTPCCRQPAIATVF
jgi:hypothetical protein